MTTPNDPRPAVTSARGKPSAAMSGRPEAAPGTPAWRGAAASVSRALRLIEAGFLDDGRRVDELADTLGMTARHLRRLFLRHAGASPTAVATTRRVQRAKTLLDETALPVSAVAFAAGFTSIRRFNAAFRSVYRRPPSAVRRRRARRQSAADTVAARQMRRAPLSMWSATTAAPASSVQASMKAAP